MTDYNHCESIIVSKKLSGKKLNKWERSIYKEWDKRHKRILANWKLIEKLAKEAEKETMPF